MFPQQRSLLHLPPCKEVVATSLFSSLVFYELQQLLDIPSSSTLKRFECSKTVGVALEGNATVVVNGREPCCKVVRNEVKGGHICRFLPNRGIRCH